MNFENFRFIVFLFAASFSAAENVTNSENYTKIITIRVNPPPAEPNGRKLVSPEGGVPKLTLEIDRAKISELHDHSISDFRSFLFCCFVF